MLLALVCASCAVIYPELATPIGSAPGGKLEPPPPPNLYYIAFGEVEVPPRTRDGKDWDEGGGAPDPYGIVFINGKELFRTTVARDTFEPKWPDVKKRNYSIPANATLRVELWDENPMNSRPICVRTVKKVQAEAEDTGELDLSCDTGARLVLEFTPAKARWGVGMYYELGADGPVITRVILHSPATRAGLKGGEKIVSINGRKTAGMNDKEVRSTINANVDAGLDLVVQTGLGTKTVRLEEGPIYTLVDER